VGRYESASYAVMGLVAAALFAAYFLRETKQTFNPRRRQPWDP
jgi:hypothetical protein